METLEAKLKIGYISRKKAMFSDNRRQGTKPSKIFNFLKKQRNCFEELQNHLTYNEQSDEQTDPQASEKKPSFFKQVDINPHFRYPFSSIGLIVCEQGGQKVIGTGFLIGSNYVLTSAQNVWSFRDKKIAQKISFCPAFQNNSESRAYRAEKVSVPDELYDGSTSVDALLPYNFAVIELEGGSIQHEYGTMTLNFAPKLSDNEQITIAGYTWYGMSKGFCELTGTATLKGDMISHSVNAAYGVCGAPILQMTKGTLEVVGMHLFSRQRQGNVEKGGIKFNENMLRYLKKWCILEEQQIDLREKQLGKSGLKQLSKLKWNNLTSLNLSRNNLDSTCVKYLKNTHWKTIIDLDLGGNQIRKEGAQALALSELSAITTLNLWGNGIGKKGAFFLSLGNWNGLTNLNLYNNDIGDEGVEYLIQAKWPNLNNLNLGKNGITSEGAKLILQGSWPQLVSLNLWGNNFKGEQSNLKSIFHNHFQILKYLYL